MGQKQHQSIYDACLCVRAVWIRRERPNNLGTKKDGVAEHVMFVGSIWSKSGRNLCTLVRIFKNTLLETCPCLVNSGPHHVNTVDGTSKERSPAPPHPGGRIQLRRAHRVRWDQANRIRNQYLGSPSIKTWSGGTTAPWPTLPAIICSNAAPAITMLGARRGGGRGVFRQHDAYIGCV